MKIAIHHRPGSFSDRWITYCQQKGIDYKIVNCYDSDIIEQLVKENITHFMWHINHASAKDLMVFPYIMNSIESIGIKCFPNFNTRWHFDDKIAQKYLLESINAPLVPSYACYSESEALSHLKSISFPIVAKLKRGAGATNVKLLRSFEEAEKYVKIMFSTGINPNAGAIGNLDQKLRIAKQIKNPIHLIKKTYGFLVKNRREQKIGNYEKGYFYYQKFMPENDFDTRVIIVGDKAVAFKRINRENDFRASGSGKSSFEDIDVEMIRIAFETYKKINAQSLAYDFIYDEDKKPKIIEVCFGFGTTISSTVPFYWDDKLIKHKGEINMQFEMMNFFLKNNR